MFGRVELAARALAGQAGMAGMADRADTVVDIADSRADTPNGACSP